MAFEGLSEKLQGAFKDLRGQGVISEKDFEDAMRVVKMALLDISGGIATLEKGLNAGGTATLRLKDDGKLNALIIPEAGSDAFAFESWDPFPERRAKTAQRGSETSYYIRWGDNKVQVLSRGAEFSRVRHVRTGYEMDVLTRFLKGEGEFVRVNDSTDYVPPVAPGDALRVVAETSRGYLVKRGGVSGWYYGELI